MYWRVYAIEELARKTGDVHKIAINYRFHKLAKGDKRVELMQHIMVDLWSIV